MQFFPSFYKFDFFGHIFFCRSFSKLFWTEIFRGCFRAGIIIVWFKAHNVILTPRRKRWRDAVVLIIIFRERWWRVKFWRFRRWWLLIVWWRPSWSFRSFCRFRVTFCFLIGTWYSCTGGICFFEWAWMRWFWEWIRFEGIWFCKARIRVILNFF